MIRVGGDVCVDAIGVGRQNPLAVGVIAGPLCVVERTPVLQQTRQAVAFDGRRPEHFGQPSFELAPPPFHFPEAVLRHDVALGEKQVAGVLRIDVGDAPLVANDVHRLL